MRDRGKRRTVQRVIGGKGEALFQAWAHDRSLEPNRTEGDFGVDVYCQVFARLEDHKDEATGAVLAAQVRSTGRTERRRATLDRVDAETLLRHKCPACVIGVDVSSGEIRYRVGGEECVQ